METNSPVAQRQGYGGHSGKSAPHSISACPACIKASADAMRYNRSAPRTDAAIRQEALQHAAAIARGKQASYTRKGETAKASAAFAIAERIRADFDKGAV